MHVLFDNGVPRGVASGLSGHVVEEARDRGWDRLKNGDLLDAAETAGFDVLVTTDAISATSRISPNARLRLSA